ncbi:MAG: Maf family nucleotide pyrophosphatase, partial [Bacteroidota bacterium]
MTKLTQLIPKLANYQVILGSGSPRRKELLIGLGIDFIVRKKEVEEDIPEEVSAYEAAEFLARKKSLGQDLAPNELLITSDTTVVLENKIYNKPADVAEATQMLEELSGSTHAVITGVCLRTAEKEMSFSETALVTLKKMTSEEISFYIQAYQPFDKAGAYGIQEWIGMACVTRIEGDYYAVMGLPTFRIYQSLKELLG